MPPQAANSLLTESGLAENGWGAQDPSSLQALGDERIFIVGDAVGKVSPLFGHYVKSGHVAAQLGIIAAEQIAARLAGTVAPELFPEAICHVLTGLAPEAALRIEARYRRRGDGVITQETRQQRDAQPRGEAQAWLDGMLEQWF